MLEEKDSIATPLLVRYKNIPMPNLSLGDIDVDALLTFLGLQNVSTTSKDVGKSRPTDLDQLLHRLLF